MRRTASTSRKSQGEDVVSGVRTPMGLKAMAEAQPKAAEELESVCDALEDDFKDMLDIEFTIEDGELYILQCRVGKRTGTAGVRIATEMFAEGIISKDEALMKVNAQSLEQVLHPVFLLDAASPDYSSKIVASGLPASPGAAVGQIVFSSKEAKEYKSQGKPMHSGEGRDERRRHRRHVRGGRHFDRAGRDDIARRRRRSGMGQAVRERVWCHQL